MIHSYLFFIVIKYQKKQIVAIFDLKQKTIKASNTQINITTIIQHYPQKQNTTQPNKQSMITIKPLSLFVPLWTLNQFFSRYELICFNNFVQKIVFKIFDKAIYLCHMS